MPTGVYTRRFRRMKRHAVVQPPDPSYRLIPLTQGQTAIVDTEDYERFLKFNWYASWCSYTKSFYARRDDKNRRRRYMHREVLRCSQIEKVDHWNHNTLDNRRKNLRKATKSQNNQNKRMQSNNKSGYIGVYWFEQTQKWQAYISVGGKRIHLGYFNTSKEAARVRDKAAKKYHGEFAVLNFPD